ncbi:MAG: HNH endonuclease [bacterium]
MNKEVINKVWSTAKTVRGEHPDKVRQDPYGNRIARNQYGSQGLRGWEIDHIKPEARGGSDHLRNLQAMQSKKNRELGDSLKKRSRQKR